MGVWDLFVATLSDRRVIALSQLRPGQTGVICEAKLEADDAALLRAMGLCCNAHVRLCRAGEPCIVALTCGRAGTKGGGPGEAKGPAGSACRVGLARPLAERIMVDVGGQP
jgi:hypothetical protein